MDADRPHFTRAAVIGIGLIGASFALAAKRAGVVEHIIGVARRQSTRMAAEQIGAADETTDDPVAAVAGADLVYLATPVTAIVDLLAKIAPALKPGCLVTDAGSVKVVVCRAAERVLPPSVSFVGGHPMAGSERSGPQHADADLFAGHSYFVVPAAPGGEVAAERLCAIVQRLGARPLVVDPETHDRVLAATSHLPHAVASALMLAVADLADPGQRTAFSAGGLRDTTRIAASSPELWRDIFIANADNLAAACRLAARYLDEIAAAASAADGQRLQKLLARARDAREKL